MPDSYSSKRPGGRGPVNLVLIILALVVVLLLVLLVRRPWDGAESPDGTTRQSAVDETTTGESPETTDLTPTPAGTTDETTAETTDETTAETTDEPTGAGALPGTTVNLVAVGDVLFHETLIAGGLQDDGSYNYDFVFQYVTDRVREADVAFADMEGTLAGEPYTGYPAFSAPDAVAEAVANAGFSGMYLANNHSIDRGYSGLTRTLEVVRGQELLTIGTRLDMDEPDWLDLNINGIKVGIANWTYETAMDGSAKTLNGIPITEDLEGLVNSFGMEPERQPAEFARVAEQAKAMREAGCELVVFFCHWGTEYRMENDWAQLGLAGALADANVDLIIGNGPHVIEPIHVLTNEAGTHSTLVYYSVGNFISDQSYAVGGSEGRALDGLLADVTFTLAENGSMELTDAAYMPLYVAKTRISETATRNTAVPVVAALGDPAAYGNVPVSELEASLARTRRVMDLNDTGGLEVREY